jgi:endonuclease/exonuclease/phosphatase family metal-dependent hydrolase
VTWPSWNSPAPEKLGGVSESPAPGSTPVRLITFNTHHGVGGDQRHDLPRLAQVLARADADVICLQEVDRYFGERSEDVDQAELLSRGLDMQLAWAPSIEEPRAGSSPRQYGNALLSRLPILASDMHRLPGSGEPRSALNALVDLDGATLRITTTHLSGGDPGRRAEQVAALAALHADPAEAGVVVGDFNTGPDAAELTALRERFTDAWELAQERDDRAGWRFWHRGHGDTFPARGADRRIDQVWVTPGVEVTAARVLRGEGASDHLPVVVDLVVPG